MNDVRECSEKWEIFLPSAWIPRAVTATQDHFFRPMVNENVARLSTVASGLLHETVSQFQILGSTRQNALTDSHSMKKKILTEKQNTNIPHH